MIKKKIVRLIALLIVIIYIFMMFIKNPIFANSLFEPTDFPIRSQALYLVSMDNGDVLYKKNETQQLPPASLTKIMTAIVVLETIKPEDLDKEIECYADIMSDSYWYEQGASLSGFLPGEIVSIRKMLYGLLLQSGCDMGDVLAHYTATTYLNGDIKTFVQKMNDKAKEIGALNTNFVNTHGLDADGQVTTAYDMYLISKYALSNPVFTEICQTDVYYVAPTNKHAEKFPIINTNDMIFSSREYYYEPVKAVKTGTTGVNTQNLVTTASQNGFNYMLVVLGGKYLDEQGNRAYDTYKDTINFYEWAFDDFSLRNIIKKGDTSSGVEVKVNLSTAANYIIGVPEVSVEKLIPDNITDDAIKKISKLPKSIDAPIKEGQKLGTMDLVINGEVLQTVNIVATKNIERSTILYIMKKLGQFFNNSITKIVLIFILAILLLYVLFITNHNNKHKNNHKKQIRKDPPSKIKRDDNNTKYKVEYYNPRNNSDINTKSINKNNKRRN